VAKEGRQGKLKNKFGITIEIESVDLCAAYTKGENIVNSDFQRTTLSY